MICTSFWPLSPDYSMRDLAAPAATLWLGLCTPPRELSRLLPRFIIGLDQLDIIPIKLSRTLLLITLDDIISCYISLYIIAIWLVEQGSSFSSYCICLWASSLSGYIATQCVISRYVPLLDLILRQMPWAFCIMIARARYMFTYTSGLLHCKGCFFSKKLSQTNHEPRNQ